MKCIDKTRQIFYFFPFPAPASHSMLPFPAPAGLPNPADGSDLAIRTERQGRQMVRICQPEPGIKGKNNG